MVWDVARAACMRRARLKAGGQGTRGAHVEHPVHVCNLGRVEAERLVERLRLLPSRKAGMRCDARGGPHSRLWVGRARAERTPNIHSMSVTSDVSKLSGWLNADAPCRVERRAYDAGRGVGRGRLGVGWRQRITSGMHRVRARL